MRVTDESYHQLSRSGLRRVTDRVTRLRAEAASGVRIQGASDGGADGRRVGALDLAVRSLESLAGARDTEAEIAGARAGAWQEVADQLTRARVIVLEVLSQPHPGPERLAAAEALEGLLEEFRASAGGTFRGADLVELGALDRPELRGATSYSGRTGAEAGPGTDGGTGIAFLRFAHSRTSLGDGAGRRGGDSVSGLRPAENSPASDSVLGTHQVGIERNPLTGDLLLSLDGGPAVRADGSETALVVRNAEGDAVHLDVTGVAPLFTGTVTVRGEGTMSFGGGGPVVPVDFSADQLVTDAAGRPTRVDTRGVRRTGDEEIRYSGTGGPAEILEGLVRLLRDPVPSQGLADRLRGVLTEIDRLHDAALGEVLRTADRQTEATSAADVARALGDRTETERALLAEPDFPVLLSDLARGETLLGLLYQVTGLIQGL